MTRRHQRLVVPTDFSPGAALALERALRLPLSRHAKLLVLHVLPDSGAPGAEAAANELFAEAMAKLKPRSGLEVSFAVATGKPFEQIISRARSFEADLIVIGRHGRRAVRDLFIGSTASRTVRYGDAPVLVVNGDAKRAYQRPLIATDLDDVTPRVIELALSVLEPEIDSIDVLHAFHVPFESLHYLPRTGQLERELEVAARENMDRLLGAVGADRARWNPILRYGDPRAIIVSEVMARETDLVALATHARSGLAHAVIGSVAEEVVRTSPCDVLVTRPSRFTFSMP